MCICIFFLFCCEFRISPFTLNLSPKGRFCVYLLFPPYLKQIIFKFFLKKKTKDLISFSYFPICICFLNLLFSLSLISLHIELLLAEIK